MHRLCSGLLALVFLATAACSSDGTTKILPDGYSGQDARWADHSVNPEETVIIGVKDSTDKDVKTLDFGKTDNGLPDPDVGDAPDLGDVEQPDIVEPEDGKDAAVQPDEVSEPDIPDGPCIPDCTGKECGSDGCTGVCGYCAYGYLCDPGGFCQASLCEKKCTTTVDDDVVWSECGPDNCGGYCGFCLEDDTECGDDGICYAGSCNGSCAGKQCGDDGCGHTCGFCQFGEWCDDDGQCVPHPCGTVTYKGKCISKWELVECVDLEVVTTMCKTIKDHMCGWDQNVGAYACVPETECEPECTLSDGTVMECGDNGCWGSCGTCPTGWGCSVGRCKPALGGECAWIDSQVGVCVADVRWFCSSGILYSYDCEDKENKSCGWDFTANFGAGGYDCIL
jgi:hypothetical protein